MSLLSATRVALGTLLAHKGRSALTTLGIVLGIAAVVAVASAGSGARFKLEDSLESVGTNLILVRPGTKTALGTVEDASRLSSEDADAIRRQVGPLLTGVAESQQTLRPASAGGRHWPTLVVGTVPELRQVRDWAVKH